MLVGIRHVLLGGGEVELHWAASRGRWIAAIYCCPILFSGRLEGSGSDDAHYSHSESIITAVHQLIQLMYSRGDKRDSCVTTSRHGSTARGAPRCLRGVLLTRT